MKKLKKIFAPEEIIFVPTQECNLRCAHCFVPKTSGKLDEEKALGFLKDAANDGIMQVGFSGGEPFLAVDFLCRIISSAVEKGLYFDRLMTNAVAFKDADDMQQKIEKIFEAGFDGVFGISYDAFHAQKADDIALFIKTVEAVYKERNHVSIVCTKKDTADEKTLLMLKELAEKLDLSFENETQNALQDKQIYFPDALIYKDKLETFINDGLEYDYIPVETISFIEGNALDENAWQSSEWFAEDFCAGPGHVYYVHANGDVAACCGYANECSDLILGNINTMSYKEIAAAAKKSCKKGFLRTVYKTGLLKEAEKLEKKGHKFPGKGHTKDNCLFCRYYLQNMEH